MASALPGLCQDSTLPGAMQVKNDELFFPRKVSLDTSDLELLELSLCLKSTHTGAETIGPTTLQMSLL